MKKSILNLGKVLNKTEQKQIKGAWMIYPGDGRDCGWNMCENAFGRCSVFAC